MQRQPPAAPGPLPLPRTRSSCASSASTPHTPTGGHSQLPLFSSNTNRNSSSSWNSSSCDDADDIEWEWKPDQIMLLSRTLDALPSHLLTPFNGPVPPSNLLDKIARRVAEAKGPIDWQHSLRATRAKIVELARIRAKETSDSDATDTIAEEDSSQGVPLQQTTNTGPKRPLYRQSSMDFMQTPKIDINDNSSLRRLSHRLQRTERMLATPSYHPYARSTTPTFDSPSHTRSLNPSTPSSSTLNSSIDGCRPSHYRRSCSSTISSSSDDPFIQPIVPRPRRLRRADTFTSSALCTPSRHLKRAPSFGTSSRNSRDSAAMSVDFSTKDSDVTSSDEEEKLRTKRAKKARTQAASPIPHSQTSTQPSSAQRKKSSKTSTAKSTSQPSTSSKGSAAAAPSKPSKPRANVKRNPSILGPELPHPQPTPKSPAAAPRSPVKSTRPKVLTSPSSSGPTSPRDPSLLGSPVQTPPKTLRRTKGSVHPSRRAPARKISFGSILPATEEDNPAATGTGCGLGLGSAFQLQ
ncbi:hypothetical protein K474DRAFT_1706147 [Panus rudis PR-1116 ss-1]|nr:hypothetical protein K474DRAFT_1706147 [Panus rudis PR-1116 ss-1]